MNSRATFSDGLLHIDTSGVADWKKLTFFGSVRTLDAISRIYQDLTGTDGERERQETMLSARFDVDNGYDGDVQR